MKPKNTVNSAQEKLQEESYHLELTRLASIKSGREEKELYSLSDDELQKIINYGKSNVKWS